LQSVPGGFDKNHTGVLDRSKGMGTAPRSRWGWWAKQLSAEREVHQKYDMQIDILMEAKSSKLCIDDLFGG
jgi:hypothetical protein